jgi:hypothetical protein
MKKEKIKGVINESGEKLIKEQNKFHYMVNMKFLIDKMDLDFIRTFIEIAKTQEIKMDIYSLQINYIDIDKIMEILKERNNK